MPAEALAACEDLPAVDASFCRVRARLHHARLRRDTVLVACLNGPFQRLQAITGAQADAGPEGGRVGDVMLTREALRLELEAESCSGQ